MSDKKYSNVISILFVIASSLGYLYLSSIFTLTDFLKETKVNSLIPIIITFFLGVGLKSIYTFFMSSLILYSKDYEDKHKFTISIIDFITALTFFSYVMNVVNNKYLYPIIIMVGVTLLLTVVIQHIHSYPAIKKRFKNKSK